MSLFAEIDRLISVRYRESQEIQRSYVLGVVYKCGGVLSYNDTQELMRSLSTNFEKHATLKAKLAVVVNRIHDKVYVLSMRSVTAPRSRIGVTDSGYAGLVEHFEGMRYYEKVHTGPQEAFVCGKDDPYGY